MSYCDHIKYHNLSLENCFKTGFYQHVSKLIRIFYQKFKTTFISFKIIICVDIFDNLFFILIISKQWPLNSEFVEFEYSPKICQFWQIRVLAKMAIFRNLSDSPDSNSPNCDPSQYSPNSNSPKLCRIWRVWRVWQIYGE